MKKFTLLLFLTGIFIINSNAQTEKFKALFIFNFTKYIEWPAYQRQGDFIIGVFGITGLSGELKIIADKQKIGHQKIVVKTFLSLQEIQKCQILYVAPAKSSLINDIITKLGSNSTLIITDKKGMALKGAGINYVMIGDRIDYEMNVKNIQNRGLIVNHSLLALGRTVKN